MLPHLVAHHIGHNYLPTGPSGRQFIEQLGKYYVKERNNVCLQMVVQPFDTSCAETDSATSA